MPNPVVPLWEDINNKDGYAIPLIVDFSSGEITTATIATTGNTDGYFVAPESGSIAAIDFSGVDALATSDVNYITFSVTNLGQSGAGTTVILGAVNANTTKTTGGSALAANTKRSLTLTTTAADLVVAKGDRLRIRAAVTGTLANTVTFPVYAISIARNSVSGAIIRWPSEVSWVAESHDSAGSGTVTVDVLKAETGVAMSAGTSVLASAFDLTTTANTPVMKTDVSLTQTSGGRTFITGSRLGYKVSGSMTGIGQVILTVYFKYVGHGGYR